MELLCRIPLDVAFKLIGSKTAGALNRFVSKDGATLKTLRHCYWDQQTRKFTFPLILSDKKGAVTTASLINM